MNYEDLKKHKSDVLTFSQGDPLSVCPICGSIGNLYHKYKYCPECGQRIKVVSKEDFKKLRERVEKLKREDFDAVTCSGCNGWNDVRGIFEGLLRKKEKEQTEADILEGQMNIFELEQEEKNED